MRHILKYSYTLIAPIYDAIVAHPTKLARQHSLKQLPTVDAQTILLCGVGSGLDFPHLPTNAHYIGIDLTPAMLKRACQRATTQPPDISLHQGDVMQLPYADESYHHVIMHLILSVVPEPQQALNEAMRVVKTGGKIIILDKFLRPNQYAPIRRFISPLMGKIATRTDVVFENLQRPTHITVLQNTPAALNGWFRHIVLEKNIATYGTK
ncbi:methylase involved in ubiquinone/menaquinone biosynthesis [Beggiatoa alba B18LD]|uniref:Methylase involved in ubiquinone/menaquinone biosynthesis n=1 Tax=Beggiatoa alba B18LD TaxID=395493 RepID=I3CEN0_9GAMM|nr:class I SAM-dependent methyltransferase [Beggiatoa alba]EIJ42073.1 methylase involved in ubiquinone/menaquinone biosynthesis [Beggiatoa alba B18LD]